ncbi:MAG: hypothetical protein ACYTGW_11315 [Planctomycetota bacterium]|jgi:hypothetical protein
MRTPLPAILASLLALLAACACAQEPPVSQHERTPPGQAGPGGSTAAESKIPRMETGGKNDWFDRTRLQMGDHLQKKTIKGLFKFKNPRKDPVQFSAFTGSCQCAKAVIRVGERKYALSKVPKDNALHKIELKNGHEVKTEVSRITIDSGESGEIEVHMEMAGIQGVKEASLQFATSDKKYPLMLLKWEAMGVKLFNIRPADFFLNDMKWEDEKVFRFQISSSVKKDFKLLDHEALPSFVKVKKKQIKLPDGTPAWEVSGTFGPKADPGSGGAAIKFKTDLDNQVVSLNVIANVLGPISITPGTFIPFGRIKKQQGAERKVTITPNGDFDLELEKIEFRRLKIDRKYLKVHHEKKGKNVVISLKVLPGAAPKRRMVLVRGVMVVHLNHPAMKTKNFSFNGILR